MYIRYGNSLLSTSNILNVMSNLDDIKINMVYDIRVIVVSKQ